MFVGVFFARKLYNCSYTDFVVACENSRHTSRRREMRGACIFRLPFLTLLLLGFWYVPSVPSVVVVVAAVVTESDIIFVVVVYGFRQTYTIKETACETSWNCLWTHLNVSRIHEETLPVISLNAISVELLWKINRRTEIKHKRMHHDVGNLYLFVPELMMR